MIRKDKKEKPFKQPGDLGKEGLTFKIKEMKSKGVIATITVLFLIFGFTAAQNINEQQKAHPAPIDERPIIHVLFIGNDYTSRNNMASLLQNLAKHDPDKKFTIKTLLYTEPKAHLSHLWNDPNRKKVLQQEDWDYVVLQPDIFWAMTKEKTRETDRALKEWINAIRTIGAKPIFFMTWPLKKTSNLYKNEHYPFLASPKQMYQNIYNRTRYIAKKHDLAIMPIGDYWLYTTLSNPELNLYADNGNHPSLSGSYLIALLFYKEFTNTPLYNVTYKPKDLSKNQKDMLIDLAETKIPPP